MLDLGIARADLVEAGLLRNPILSLLFPLGPKQLEFTLQYPFEVLWQRPARVGAARLNAQAIGERLVWDALSLVAQVRTAHADALTADRRLVLATQNAELTRRLADITDARLRAGDISDLEARAPGRMPHEPTSCAVPCSTIAIWRGSRWQRSSVSIECLNNCSRNRLRPMMRGRASSMTAV